MLSRDVKAKLRRACKEAGSQAAWAKANNLGAAYVSDVLNGRREPGAKMLQALGLERVICYRERYSGDVKT